MFWYGLYSKASLWEAWWGVPFIGDTGLYWFAPVCSEKLDFYALDGIMGEIGLLLDRWCGRIKWDGGGIDGPTLVGAKVVPPLSV